MSTTDLPDEARFVPGTIVAERYRIVEQLGKGGMGEVFRAEDLTLGQSVALKFLPAEMAESEEHLERFLGEVRVARQVSHPNICRVHDVGQVEGQYFISMEYVDGEDLASLLRRIGRLPQAKAIEIARQLCAGMAAAHRAGILHRDLKPANVMLDGRGQARIADFGLAAAAASLGRADIRVGTPAYMAPEQLAGESVSASSDVWGLGLVLFEMFTGRPAFEAKTLDDLMAAQREKRPSASKFVPDLDPVVEALLQRCLSPNPADRPQSANEVLGALPGGDPLAAALAAGETPSIELVASAGGAGGLRPGVAAALAAVILLVLIAVGWAGSQSSLFGQVDPPYSAPVLVERARETAAQLGWHGPNERSKGEAGKTEKQARRVRRHSAHGFFQASIGRPRATIADPAATWIRFWYREKPSPFVPLLAHGRVYWGHPQQGSWGEFSLVTGADGRLVSFRGVSAVKRTNDFDWNVALRLAKLDPAKLTKVEGDEALDWRQPYTEDEQCKFRGPHPEIEGLDVVVKLARQGSRLTWFGIDLTWKDPVVKAPASSALKSSLVRISEIVLICLGVFGGAWFGARNLARGRGDRRNATRIALYFFAVSMLRWLLTADHVADLGVEFSLMLRAMQNSVFFAVMSWFLYVAIEPTIRANWPQTLVAWGRVLTGRFSDPLVGRDALIGILGAALVCGLAHVQGVAAEAFGGETLARTGSLDLVRGARYVLGYLFDIQGEAAMMALLASFLFVIARLALRNSAAAFVAMLFFGLLRMPQLVMTSSDAINFGFRLVQIAIIMLVLWRVGLLAAGVMFVFLPLINGVPLHLDLGAWWSGASTTSWVIAVVLTLACAWNASRPSRQLAIAVERRDSGSKPA